MEKQTTCKRIGKKYSRHRELLLQELKARCDHPTADDLFVAMKQDIPNISLGTVYRNLSTLVDAGQVLRIDSFGSSRYDADTSEHVHFVCTNCGAVSDLDVKMDPDICRMAAEKSGGQIHTHRLAFFGHCAKCAQLIQLSVV